ATSRRAGAVVPAGGHSRACARGRRRRLPRAEPAGMTGDDLLALTAAQAAATSTRGELAPGELFELYRDRAGADRAAGAAGLNCFTWVADDVPAGAGDAARTPLGGVPLAVKD